MRGWQAWAVMLAGALLSIYLQGFSLPNNGNSYHYPIVLDYAASAEGPHDAFTQSLRFYVTHFWTVVGWLVTEQTLPAVFLALHLAFRLLLILGLRLVLLRLAETTPAQATWAAAALPSLLFHQLGSPLGHGEVLLDSLSHSTAIVSVILCAWGLALGGRFRWAALLLGLGFNIKGFMAVWAALTLAGALLAARPRRDWRGSFLELLRLALLFTLGALPTVIWILASWSQMTLDAGGAPFDQRPFLLAFYPGHVMVWTHPPPEWLLGLLYAGGFLLLWRLGGAGLRADARRALGGLWLASLAIVLLAIPLPLLTGNPMLLNASPLRIDGFLVWLFAILLMARLLAPATPASLLLLAALALLSQSYSALLALLVLAQPEARRRPALIALLAAAALVLWWDATPDGGVNQGRILDLLAVGPLLVALPLLLPAMPARLPRLALLGALTLLDYLAGHGLLTHPGLPGALLLLALAGTLAWPGGRTTPIVAAAPGPPPPRRPWRPLLPLALATLALLLVPPTLHLARSGHLDRYDPRALAFLELQRWARQATPPDSLFLQPDEQLRPNLTPSFWTLSRRPAWVDWRMGAAVHWQPSFHPLWQQRMDEVRGLATVAAKLDYAHAMNIPYIILEAAEALPPGGPAPLYDDGVWRVLQVD